METINGGVQVSYRYAVHFTSGLFDLENATFRAALSEGENAGRTARVLFVVEEEVERLQGVCARIAAYCVRHAEALALAGPPLVLPGGERVKNDLDAVGRVHRAVHETGLDRHSYLAVIGGGALLDAVGYAAATAHRGIRLIRIPTTTLSQCDSGVGVKNGVNAFGKKNFVGTFAPPWAVLNDARFLETLPPREWRAGLVEAVKVALIKDAAFFEFLEGAAPALVARDLPTMGAVIHRCAELHVAHIRDGGDPFENGSSRPLDFGHWSAHKLEQLTDYRLRHGEAVAIGVALDATYSHLQGWLSAADCGRVIALLSTLGFALTDPALSHPEILRGLQEFREHLGGELTIQMLRGIGTGYNVHVIDEATMRESIERMRESIERMRELAPGASPRVEATLAGTRLGRDPQLPGGN